MTFGQLMGFVRENFPGDVKRNGSILKALLKRWGAIEVEYMVRGAAKLGWKDLRALHSKEDVGRRVALQAFWADQKREKAPEALKAIFRRMTQ